MCIRDRAEILEAENKQLDADALAKAIKVHAMTKTMKKSRSAEAKSGEAEILEAENEELDADAFAKGIEATAFKNTVKKSRAAEARSEVVALLGRLQAKLDAKSEAETLEAENEELDADAFAKEAKLFEDTLFEDEAAPDPNHPFALHYKKSKSDQTTLRRARLQLILCLTS